MFKTKLENLTKLVLWALVACLLLAAPSLAQVRPLYTPGFNATNSGVLPAPGFTYMNYFEYYSFDTLKGPNGETVNADLNSAVFIDINLFLYVTKAKLLGGNLAFAAGLPVANTSISLADRPVLGIAGFAESFYQPFLIGWHKDRYDLNAGYSFFADTGKAGAGYWANALSFGDTFYLTKNKALSFSSYQLVEFHTKDGDTGITPGTAFNLDYSLMMFLPLQKEEKALMQFGLVGYGQWQISDDGGSADPLLKDIHYRVYALGFAVNFILPPKGVSVGMKYFNEFGAKATVEGKNLQIFAAVTF
jgi:hypothetical protein